MPMGCTRSVGDVWINRGACFEYLQMLAPLQCFGTVLVSLSMIA